MTLKAQSETKGAIVSISNIRKMVVLILPSWCSFYSQLPLKWTQM